MDLAQASVLIIGVGGIGSHVAVSLARAGVGHLHLIDFDVVEASNLGRQYYTYDDVGHVKVEALARHMREANPSVLVTTQNEALTKGQLELLCKTYRYIVEAVDKASTKAWINETVLTSPEQPYVVSCSGMAGFGDSNEIRIHRKSSHWYLVGDQTSDIDEIGKITAARVMVCAGHMGNTIIRCILDDSSEERIK